MIELKYESERWVARASRREIGRSADSPLNALAKLANALADELGLDRPQLLADRRAADPLHFGDPTVQAWAVYADPYEVSGVQPEHAMYSFCERLDEVLRRSALPK